MSNIDKERYFESEDDKFLKKLPFLAKVNMKERKMACRFCGKLVEDEGHDIQSCNPLSTHWSGRVQNKDKTMINFTWKDLEIATNSIVMELKAKKIPVDYVTGIVRGGLVVGVILSHKLNKPFTITPLSINPCNLLLVDDICDTGNTLTSHIKYLSVTTNHTVKTAVIHLKPDSKFIPDIYYEKTTEWIVYPYETLETSKADYKEAQTQLDNDMNKVFSKENMAKAAKLR